MTTSVDNTEKAQAWVARKLRFERLLDSWRSGLERIDPVEPVASRAPGEEAVRPQ
jgi:hypothetical protein